jgi:hypothetical protein
MGIARPIPANHHRAAVGTYVGQPTFASPIRIMDDKTINLWRQIENGRRRGTKRGLLGKPQPKAINDN